MKSLLLVSFVAFLGTAFAQNPEPFPALPTKKGLQVQMIDDAIALGVKHAGLNVSLGEFIQPEPKPNSIRFTSNGREFTFSQGAVDRLDARVKPLSDAGAAVYAILLAYETHDPAKDAILLHPGYQRGPGANGIAAFNTATPEGMAWLRATTEFLVQRYNGDDLSHGRIWGWIVGNEVNSHWAWYNLGDAPLETVADQYEKAVRVVHDALRRYSAHGRVYLSMEHCWSRRYDPKAPAHYVPARDLLDKFASLARERGDFDWHIAYHPYPENLGEPRFWLDKEAPQADDAPVVSFKNLEVLTRHLEQPALLWQGKARRVILSEQGFHCTGKPDGELNQAAAYALAWKKVASLEGVDAFILHRHVDHAREGLNLGLWTTKPGQICNADRPRKMYEVFKAAGTPGEDAAFGFALPVIKAGSWPEALEALRK